MKFAVANRHTVADLETAGGGEGLHHLGHGLEFAKRRFSQKFIQRF